MRTEIAPGSGLWVEERPDGKLQFEAMKQPCTATVTREQLARVLQAACNECLDGGGGGELDHPDRRFECLAAPVAA